MIVTFHIAVQLVYNIWENVISLIFTTSNCIEDINYENTNQSDITIQSVGEIGFEKNEGRIIETPNQRLPSESSNIVCNATFSSENAKENEDLSEHISCEPDIFNDEDNIKDLIYNVEPKFECIRDEEGNGIRFIPPVYTQRYMMIENILKQPCWASTVKKVVDFGCAELKFESSYLKKLEGIEEIISVDVDEDVLTYNACRLMPSIPDYLKRRSTPLKIRIFCGSVGNSNEVLIGCDAVIAIELIEHLYPQDLENLPFTIFGYIQPRIAIFTTPNADFNVLFTNFSGFRHLDHKFEWSRQEFEDWGNNLIMRYPDYSVTYQGVGPGPAGTEHLGCCSQMATFVKHYDSHSVREDELHIQDGDYKLIKEYVYPYDERSREEIIRDDAISFINKQVSLSRYYQDIILKEIRLNDVMLATKCRNREKLKNILSNNNWQIKTNEAGCEVVIVPDNDSEDELSSNKTEESYGNDQVFQETGYSNFDENWDMYENESKECSAICDWESSNNVDDSQINKNTCHDSLVYGCSKRCSKSEELCNGCTDSKKDTSDTFIENESEKDYSIYETPFSNDLQTRKSTNELLNNPSNHSMYHNETNIVDGCIRALVFETSQNSDVLSPSMNETLLGNDETDHTELFCCVSNITMTSNENDKNESFCSLDGIKSPLNNSTYTTPYCSKHYNNCASKSLSLEQISNGCSSSSCTDLNSLSRLSDLHLEQKNNITKSMECFKIQDSSDIQEPCSNLSKVLDSGYPDSCSEHNMDLDLTLEQFDEIETESEGNYESESPPLSPVQALHVIDHVENGDVVNNNRDGEGNNVVADMEEDPLEFEAQIEEVNNAVPNLAGAYQQVHDIIQRSSKSNSLEGSSLDMEDHFEFESQIEESSIVTDSQTVQNVCYECINKSPGEQFPYMKEKLFLSEHPIKNTNSEDTVQKFSNECSNKSPGEQSPNKKEELFVSDHHMEDTNSEDSVHKFSYECSNKSPGEQSPNMKEEPFVSEHPIKNTKSEDTVQKFCYECSNKSPGEQFPNKKEQLFVSDHHMEDTNSEDSVHKFSYEGSNKSPGEQFPNKKEQLFVSDHHMEDTNSEDSVHKVSYECSNKSPGEQSPSMKEEPFVSEHPIKDTNSEDSGLALAYESETFMQKDPLSKRSSSPKESRSISPQLCFDKSQFDLNNANNSNCLLDSPEKATSCSENSARNYVSQESFKMNEYSSLVTLVDGCTKCDCLLPQLMNEFPKWMLSFDSSIFECRTYDKGNGMKPNFMSHLSSLAEQSVNISSDCASTRSLQSESEDIPFPAWLLNIYLSEIEEFDLESRSSETISSDVYSFDDDVPNFNYDVPYDSRAGGDQNSWN